MKEFDKFEEKTEFGVKLGSNIEIFEKFKAKTILNPPKSQIKFMIKYPKIFVTGKIDPIYDEKNLCADALEGWNLSEFKSTIPDNFCVGMIEIGKKLDISPTPKNFQKYAAEKGWIK